MDKWMSISFRHFHFFIHKRILQKKSPPPLSKKYKNTPFFEHFCNGTIYTANYGVFELGFVTKKLKILPKHDKNTPFEVFLYIKVFELI
jgi:hypothetical protein